MSNHLTSTTFPGFAYDVTELSAYIFSIDTFIISLKDGKTTVQHVTTQPDDFRQWLEHHNIRNVNEALGKMVYEHYFGKKDK